MAPKKDDKRKGIQIVKAFAKVQKKKDKGGSAGAGYGGATDGRGATTSGVKTVSRKKAKKLFTGSPKNFAKAYKGYKKTVKKRTAAAIKKSPHS